MKPKIPPIIKQYLGTLRPLLKHHYFIVVVLLFCALGYGIYTVDGTLLSTPTDDTYRTEKLQATIGGKFNQAAKNTISKIKDLQKSTDQTSSQLEFPGGRINPFGE